MKLVNTLTLTAILGLSSLYGANYNVDPSHSSVEFKVKHMMISSVKGSFEKFSGTYTFNEKSKTLSALEGKVKVASITTKNLKRDDHLKSADFFNVNKYPEMTIKLVKQEGDEAIVDLTIKDVTKTVVMNIEEINGPLKDPWGNVRSAFELHGEINRKDFHINFHKLIETGGLLVGNTVKMNFVIEGIKSK